MYACKRHPVFNPTKIPAPWRNLWSRAKESRGGLAHIAQGWRMPVIWVNIDALAPIGATPKGLCAHAVGMMAATRRRRRFRVATGVQVSVRQFINVSAGGTGDRPAVFEDTA